MIKFQRPIPNPMRIVLVIDDSDESLAATRFLCSLPLPSNSEVLTVVTATPDQTSGLRVLPEILNKVETILWARGLKWQTVMALGEPAEELTKLALQQCAELIVMGVQRLQAMFDIRMDSTAPPPLSRSLCPILAIRAPCTRVRRVLLAIDGSPHSDQAVHYLARFPLPINAKVTVIHVMPPMPVLNNLIHDRPFTEEMIAPLTMADVDRIQRQTVAEERVARALLARAVETLNTSQVATSIMLLRGDAAEEILWFTQAHTFDLIITCSPVTGQPWENVTGKLIHGAPCSVLTVNGWDIEATIGQRSQTDVTAAGLLPREV